MKNKLPEIARIFKSAKIPAIIAHPAGKLGPLWTAVYACADTKVPVLMNHLRNPYSPITGGNVKQTTLANAKNEVEISEADIKDLTVIAHDDEFVLRAMPEVAKALDGKFIFSPISGKKLKVKAELEAKVEEKPEAKAEKTEKTEAKDAKADKAKAEKADKKKAEAKVEKKTDKKADKKPAKKEEADFDFDLDEVENDGAENISEEEESELDLNEGEDTGLDFNDVDGNEEILSESDDDEDEALDGDEDSDEDDDGDMDGDEGFSDQDEDSDGDIGEGDDGDDMGGDEPTDVVEDDDGGENNSDDDDMDDAGDGDDMGDDEGMDDDGEGDEEEMDDSDDSDDSEDDMGDDEDDEASMNELFKTFSSDETKETIVELAASHVEHSNISCVPVAEKIHVIANLTPIAIATKESCKPEIQKIFGQPAIFQRALASAIEKDGLKEEVIANFGLQMLETEVVVSSAVKNEIEREKEKIQKSVDKQVADYREKYEQAVAVAAVGVTKGVFSGIRNPLKDAMIAELATLGFDDAEVIANRLFEKASESTMKVVLGKAKELASGTVENLNNFAELAKQAAFVTTAKEEDFKKDLGRIGVRREVASVEAHDTSNVTKFPALARKFGKR